jgi:hypothetical protein
MPSEVCELQLKLFDQKITGLEFCRLTGNLSLTQRQEPMKIDNLMRRMAGRRHG